MNQILFCPEKRLLKSIIFRCYNPNCKEYKHYGLKGVKNCLTLDGIKYLMERDNYSQIERPSIERKNSKGNYTIENCEFIDRGENTARRNKEHLSKPILQFDLNMVFIKEWESGREVERILGYDHSNISKVARYTQKSAYRYIWRYQENISAFYLT